MVLNPDVGLMRRSTCSRFGLAASLCSAVSLIILRCYAIFNKLFQTLLWSAGMFGVLLGGLGAASRLGAGSGRTHGPLRGAAEGDRSACGVFAEQTAAEQMISCTLKKRGLGFLQRVRWGACAAAFSRNLGFWERRIPHPGILSSTI